MSEAREYVKEWTKKGKPFRVPGFLCKRIVENEGCSYEEAQKILDQIVAEDKSLRYIKVHSGHDQIGMVFPPRTLIPERQVWIAYHQYLEPNGVYRGMRRGRPRNR